MFWVFSNYVFSSCGKTIPCYLYILEIIVHISCIDICLPLLKKNLLSVSLGLFEYQSLSICQGMFKSLHFCSIFIGISLFIQVSIHDFNFFMFFFSPILKVEVLSCFSAMSVFHAYATHLYFKIGWIVDFWWKMILLK